MSVGGRQDLGRITNVVMPQPFIIILNPTITNFLKNHKSLIYEHTTDAER